MKGYKQHTEHKDFIIGIRLEDINVKAFLLKGAKPFFNYFFYWNEELIFSGKDFRIKPFSSPKSVMGINELLAFFTIDPLNDGVVFPEDYNEKQLEWSQSNDCAELDVSVHDIISQCDEEHLNDAIEYFEKGIIY